MSFCDDMVVDVLLMAVVMASVGVVGFGFGSSP